MRLEEYFSRITHEGFLNSSDHALYSVGIEYISVYLLYNYEGEVSFSSTSLWNIYNNGSEFGMSNVIIAGNSSFTLNGFLDTSRGQILPSGGSDAVGGNMAWADFKIRFYCYPILNTSDIRYFTAVFFPIQ